MSRIGIENHGNTAPDGDRNRLSAHKLSPDHIELLLSLQIDPTNRELLNRYAFSGLRSECFPDGTLRPDLVDIADLLSPPPDKSMEMLPAPDLVVQKIETDAVSASESVNTPASTKTTRRNFLVSGLAASGLAAIGLSNEKRREETGNLVRETLARVLHEKPNLSYAATLHELVASLQHIEGIEVSVSGNRENPSELFLLFVTDDFPTEMNDLQNIVKTNGVHTAIGKTIAAKHNILDLDMICTDMEVKGILTDLLMRVSSGGRDLASPLLACEKHINDFAKEIEKIKSLRPVKLDQIIPYQKLILQKEQARNDMLKNRENALLALKQILGINEQGIDKIATDIKQGKYKIRHLTPKDRSFDLSESSPPLSPEDIARGFREELDRSNRANQSILLCREEHQSACEEELKKHNAFGVVLVRAKESNPTSVAQQQHR